MSVCYPFQKLKNLPGSGNFLEVPRLSRVVIESVLSLYYGAQCLLSDSNLCCIKAMAYYSLIIKF